MVRLLLGVVAGLRGKFGATKYVLVLRGSKNKELAPWMREVRGGAGGQQQLLYGAGQHKSEAWWKGLLFGLAVVVTATVGDLGESLIKRDLGIKDMGTLLPGHGGLMDRLDSLLPCAAVAYLLLSAFAPG